MKIMAKPYLASSRTSKAPGSSYVPDYYTQAYHTCRMWPTLVFFFTPGRRWVDVGILSMGREEGRRPQQAGRQAGRIPEGVVGIIGAGTYTVYTIHIPVWITYHS